MCQLLAHGLRHRDCVKYGTVSVNFDTTPSVKQLRVTVVDTSMFFSVDTQGCVDARGCVSFDTTPSQHCATVAIVVAVRPAAAPYTRAPTPLSAQSSLHPDHHLYHQHVFMVVSTIIVMLVNFHHRFIMLIRLIIIKTESWSACLQSPFSSSWPAWSSRLSSSFASCIALWPSWVKVGCWDVNAL